MDIVERLRKITSLEFVDMSIPTDVAEAADEIERLRGERNRLRSALKQFCDSYEPHLSPERCQHCSEAYWEARAALKEGE